MTGPSGLRRRRMARLRLRRGVFLIPSLLTTANIYCGFASIIKAFEGEFRTAAILIIVAGLLDGVDGRIARMTGGTSEFGGEYDSLADIVSFGLAPAFLVHVWGLVPLHRYGWVIAFFFMVCGAVRLARFNIQHQVSDRRWFVGLPIPMAAAALAGAVLVLRAPIADKRLSVAFGLVVVSLALLMVSRFRYRSFKELDFRARWPFRSVLVIVAIFAAVALNYRVAVLAISAVYVSSGPAIWVWSHFAADRRQDHGARTGKTAGPPAPAADGLGGSAPSKEFPSSAH